MHSAENNENNSVAICIKHYLFEFENYEFMTDWWSGALFWQRYNPFRTKAIFMVREHRGLEESLEQVS